MSEVIVERVGRTSVVTINRPEARNALTRGVVTGVRDAFLAAAADEAVRCVVLGGAGGHFCAGADLRENMMGDPAVLDHLGQYMGEYHAGIKANVGCPEASIGMLGGGAGGFGAGLGPGCELPVASHAA